MKNIAFSVFFYLFGKSYFLFYIIFTIFHDKNHILRKIFIKIYGLMIIIIVFNIFLIVFLSFSSAQHSVKLLEYSRKSLYIFLFLIITCIQQ
ncbi:hypothetical protein CG392_00565 [Gardnerella vaginalis]|nr:hypothetical protein CG392_00565 [Gardnerella vaginalis]